MYIYKAKKHKLLTWPYKNMCKGESGMESEMGSSTFLHKFTPTYAKTEIMEDEMIHLQYFIRPSHHMKHNCLF